LEGVLLVEEEGG